MSAFPPHGAHLIDTVRVLTHPDKTRGAISPRIHSLLRDGSSSESARRRDKAISYKSSAIAPMLICRSVEGGKIWRRENDDVSSGDHDSHKHGHYWQQNLFPPPEYMGSMSEV